MLGNTLVWPIIRWAMHRGARPEAVGICVTAVAAPVGVLVALFTGQDLFLPVTLTLGAVGGITWALGFALIIFYCLKIGPAGPTVTINNLGLLWPVTIGMVWFSRGQALSPLALAGVISTVLALVLVGWNRSKKEGSARLTGEWAKWVLIGWLSAGINMSSQLLQSQYAPDHPFVYMAVFYGTALTILLVISLIKRNGRLRREEVIAGTSTGIMVAGLLPLMEILLTRMSAAIVFPVAVAGPAALTLLMGHFMFRERLSAAGWAASMLGVTGIILLSPW